MSGLVGNSRRHVLTCRGSYKTRLKDILKTGGTRRSKLFWNRRNLIDEFRESCILCCLEVKWIIRKSEITGKSGGAGDRKSINTDFPKLLDTKKKKKKKKKKNNSTSKCLSDPHNV